MLRGDKSSSLDKQKPQAEHGEKAYEGKGGRKGRAARNAARKSVRKRASR